MWYRCRMTNAVCCHNPRHDEKTCSKCSLSKPLCEFPTRKSRRGETVPRNWCKKCYKVYNRGRLASPEARAKENARILAWKRDNPDHKFRERAQRFLRVYNLTLEQYWTMLFNQAGKCACCEAMEPGRGLEFFCIDHDHSCCPARSSCGSCIRGLLCTRCNSVLGAVEDSQELLNRLAEYLRG